MDHPRGCGENKEAQAIKVLRTGSPPRMRGKQGEITEISRPYRITPADAGKTFNVVPSGQQERDHPRGCGENYDGSRRIVCTKGSPPRMRGKPNRADKVRLDDRITPADAGKTAAETPSMRCTKDHPRGCGENARSTSSMPQALGSPPRMRGKPILGIGDGGSRGITPADAGKTLLGILLGVRARDHPRGCGENMKTAATDFTCLGSPPRMRGKPHAYHNGLIDHGITPADAGKTNPAELLYISSHGSPPRMRGKPLQHGRY